MDKKKILILSLAYSPFWGGAELAVKEITDHLSLKATDDKAGFQFDMITLKFKKELAKTEQVGNINVYRINSSKLLFPFKAYFFAKKLHKKHNYNIIWSIMANRAGFAALFFKWSFPKVKFLLTLQEGDPLSYPKKRMGAFYFFLKPFFKKIFTKADYIQAISKYLAKWPIEMGAKCPIQVVPNGVSITNNELLITNNQKKNNETIIISTSRLVEKNGLKNLIEATKILIDEGFNIKTLILGEGPERKNLELEIRNLKLQKKIILLGHINPENIPEYLKNADIFVRPSLSEGLGSSFLEAMAAGLPIIGTPVGGIPDFLEHKITGLFCEPNNPKSIAEQVKLLLNNKELKNEISKNGQKLVLENYTWDKVSKRMEKILNSL